MNEHKVNIHTLRTMKQRGEKIAALTAYDFFTARIMDEVGIQLILVGDSLGMAVLGYENTLPVTMDEMVHHTKAVARAKPNALVVADMPFMTYSTVTTALENAGRFIQAGADAVKLEGGEAVIDQVRALVANGVPVLGHIGLLPQSILETGGYKVQGRTAQSAERVLRDAKALEEAGVFAMVIEGTTSAVSEQVTKSVSVPTIGIGGGPHCDGQVLVSNDMLGLFTWFTPKHVKRYANLSEEMRKAFAAYKSEVESGAFPGEAQSFR
ncbi:MAG TPA: 3-methyl-2-oxobutanoate hydroxymethyltransferase [Verrucomicrobiae bacterium]|nr:3-methyl-2-oxobutanoate hydroxymethyltransferase [Verrucomicrobiae bacterium]